MQLQCNIPSEGTSSAGGRWKVMMGCSWNLAIFWFWLNQFFSFKSHVLIDPWGSNSSIGHGKWITQCILEGNELSGFNFTKFMLCEAISVFSKITVASVSYRDRQLQLFDKVHPVGVVTDYQTFHQKWQNTNKGLDFIFRPEKRLPFLICLTSVLCGLSWLSEHECSNMSMQLFNVNKNDPTDTIFHKLLQNTLQFKCKITF